MGREKGVTCERSMIFFILLVASYAISASHTAHALSVPHTPQTTPHPPQQRAPISLTPGPHTAPDTTLRSPKEKKANAKPEKVDGTSYHQGAQDRLG
eukprot:969229-Rhodomonas_salina.1